MRFQPAPAATLLQWGNAHGLFGGGGNAQMAVHQGVFSPCSAAWPPPFGSKTPKAPLPPLISRRGNTFDRARHAAGTEIKAITYSAMEVVQNAERTDVYVIVDI